MKLLNPTHTCSFLAYYFLKYGIKSLYGFVSIGCLEAEILNYYWLPSMQKVEMLMLKYTRWLLLHLFIIYIEKKYVSLSTDTKTTGKDYQDDNIRHTL